MDVPHLLELPKIASYNGFQALEDDHGSHGKLASHNGFEVLGDVHVIHDGELIPTASGPKSPADRSPSVHQQQISASKANNMLHKVEFFESILKHLPARDILLRTQLVSKRWRDMIKQSTAIQQQLFLLPVPLDKVFLVQSKSHDLGEQFKQVTVVQSCVQIHQCRPNHAYSIKAEMNPLVCSRIPCHFDQRAGTGERLIIHPYHLQNWLGTKRGPPEAWKMILTNPPVTRVTVSILDDFQPIRVNNILHGPLRKVVDKPSDGVRLGDVVEAYGLLLNALALPRGCDPRAGYLDQMAHRGRSLQVLVLCDKAGADLGPSILVLDAEEMAVVAQRTRIAAEEGLLGVADAVFA
jgi:hypothetical protein